MMEMESSNVTAKVVSWIVNVIANLRVNSLYCLSIAELEDGDKPDAVEEVAKLVGSSTYGEIYVEFDGNVKERDKQRKEDDKERRKPYADLYCNVPASSCFVMKQTNQDDCMASVNDDSSINIALWASRKVDDGSERKELIGAVTFRSSFRNRLVLVSEIAVKLAVGSSCHPKDVLSFLLSLMRMVHVHLRIIPKPEEDFDKLPAEDLAEMLDMYPYMYISEENELQLRDMLYELKFVKWDKYDYFNERTLRSEAKRSVKEGGKVLMLQRGEFFLLSKSIDMMFSDLLFLC